MRPLIATFRRRLARTVAALALAPLLLAPAAPARAAIPAAPAVPAAPASAAFPRIAILCYHDLSSDGSAPLQSVPPEFLRAQIRACRANGWTVLPLSELLAKRDRPESLPPKVLVLTFDDGYRSFPESALPILREEGVRAALSVVTSFVDDPPADLPPLLDWDELAALARSGDVEFLSHSHALHQYEPSNPWHDTGASVATRRYVQEFRRYETREEYRSRIGDDLRESQRQLVRHLGRAGVALAWPYGRHNEMARGLATLAGFAATLSLEDRAVTREDLRLGCLPRFLVTREFDFRDTSDAWLRAPRARLRAAQVDLGSIWDPDEGVFRDRLEQTVTRLRGVGATDVILPAFPDPRGDGRMVRSYAMNHQVPVLADVWSLAAARFARERMHVWLRAPSLALTWAWDRHPEWRLGADGKPARSRRFSARLSPELPAVHQAAMDLYSDLAVYLPLEGVLFDDDAFVGEAETLASEPRATAARRRAAVRELLEDCKRAVRAWRPECRFARAVPVDGTDPGPAGTELLEARTHDDLAVVTVEPNGRRGRLTPLAVTRLVRSFGERRSGALAPVVLMLPAHDARARRWLSVEEQMALATAALRAGQADLGTWPVATEGTLPIGLLDDRPVPAPVRNASRPN